MAPATKKPVSPEDFYSILTANSPAVHPKGNLIAYVHTAPIREGKGYQRSIWLTDRRRGKPRPFTAGGKGGDSSPVFSPDGKTLAFVSQRGGKPQIYLIRMDGGEARAFTSMPNGAFSPVWSHDGKWIAFLSGVRREEREEEDKTAGKAEKFMDERSAKLREDELKYQEELRIDPRVITRTVFRQDTYFKDDRTSHIYIRKVDGGEAKRITDDDRDWGSPEWSHDDRFILTSAKFHGDVDIVVRSDLARISVETGEVTVLTDTDDGDFLPRVSPDGRWIYFLSFSARDVFKQRLSIRRMPSEGGASTELMPGFDYDPHYFDLSEDGSRIYFIFGQNGRQHIWSIAADGSGGMTQITTGDRMINGFSTGGNTLVYSAEAPDMPSDLFCSDLQGANEKRLTFVNRAFLKKRWLSMPHEVWLDRPDGKRVQVWYMLPHGHIPGTPCKWVVQVHGGPHIMWGWSWWHEFQSMCSKGYGVYFSNPRGSEGYGSAFKGAIHLKWGDEDMGDILAGADRMVEMGLADPKRLYLTGGSFGGFMTAWIVGHDDRFKAAVAQRGVYNFISMYGSSDALTLIEWEFDTLPWDNTDLLWDRSPLKYVRNVKTPLMIIHSEQDFRVGIAQADELFTALKRLGCDAEFVRFPREGHELSRSGEPRHRVERINRIIGWFDRHD